MKLNERKVYCCTDRAQREDIEMKVKLFICLRPRRKFDFLWYRLLFTKIEAQLSVMKQIDKLRVSRVEIWFSIKDNDS